MKKYISGAVIASAIVLLLVFVNVQTKEPENANVVPECINYQLGVDGMSSVDQFEVTKDGLKIYTLEYLYEDKDKPYHLYCYEKQGESYGKKQEINIPDELMPISMTYDETTEELLCSLVDRELFLKSRTVEVKGPEDLINYTAKVAKVTLDDQDNVTDISYLDSVNQKDYVEIYCKTGDKLLYTISDSPYEIGDLTLATYKEDGTVTDITKVLFDNQENYGIYSAVLSGDGNTIFMSTMDFSQSEEDIDFTLMRMEKKGGEYWSEPEDVMNVTGEAGQSTLCLSTSKEGKELDFVAYKEGDQNYYGCDTEQLRNYVPTDLEEEKLVYSDEYETNDFKFVSRNKQDEKEKQGIFYEIFVRSFADSNNDGIGDLEGVTEKLDYLQELGVDRIWLMPIFESPSYHGYDVINYEKINPEYGTMDDLKKLIKEAHKRGIKIILDYPINDTSTQSEWFKEAQKDPNSKYANYYRWVNKEDTEHYKLEDKSAWGSTLWYKKGNNYYYGIFSSQMPDLNYNNPDVRTEIKDIAKSYIEMGIDGFRLDAAMHIYGDNEFSEIKDQTEENVKWWNEFAVALEEVNPQVILVGEAWHEDDELKEYVQPFDSKFDFTLQQHLLLNIAHETAYSHMGGNLSKEYEQVLADFAQVDKNYLDGVFLSNHDQDRIASTLGEEKSRLAANVAMTMPGNVFVYYGEELGMLGSGDDRQKRTSIPWGDLGGTTTAITTNQNDSTLDAAQQMNASDSMYSHYKQLIALRNNTEELVSGSYRALDVDNDKVMAYVRETSKHQTYIFHNFSKEPQTITCNEVKNGEVIYQKDSQNVDKNGTITVAPFDSVMIRVTEE